ncbi:SDR family NAD(P)-dependent oxidoreductase [Pseudomonas citri]|uniref:SDR family NAD(P)-dependent oxidoreductase n=1 Tax=Pseudomonas citri TaxID=2978349 RepID=UPI0021B65CB4|nr:SDR family oxidoreductase [Pseudomonas citri]
MGLRMPQRYWLTGAGDGIGSSLAEAILLTGAHLAVSSRSAKGCDALSARYPGQVLTVPGHLTDGQTVREIGERIARQWGTLDKVIINAGTAEYVEGQPGAPDLIEHIVRSNLLAASFCIEVATPLLRVGTEPHLVGIASPATYLPPSQAEAGVGIRHLFESVRGEFAQAGIDVTLVHPGFNTSSGCLPAPSQWSADEAAAHVLGRLIERPAEVALPVSSMTELWPLPSSAQTTRADAPHRTGAWSPLKGRP